MPGNDSNESSSNGNDAQRYVPKTFSVVFQITLPIQSRAYFENEWLNEIYDIVSSWKGFLHRNVHLLSLHDDFAEYAVTLAFDSIHDLNRWLVSSERRERMNQLLQLGALSMRLNEYGGVMEMDGKTMELQGVSDEDFAALEKKQQANALAGKGASRITLQETSALHPRKLPPPKWKLFIIIWVCAGSLVLVGNFGGSVAFFAAAKVPLGLNLFFFVVQLVLLLVYCLLPLVMCYWPINNWLRQPRPCPEDMHPIHAVLDQGLAMFAAKSHDTTSTANLERIEKLEGRLNRLRNVNHDLSRKVQTLESELYRGDNMELSCHTEASLGRTQHVSEEVVDLEAGENIEAEEGTPLLVAPLMDKVLTEPEKSLPFVQRKSFHRGDSQHVGGPLSDPLGDLVRSQSEQQLAAKSRSSREIALNQSGYNFTIEMPMQESLTNDTDLKKNKVSFERTDNDSHENEVDDEVSPTSTNAIGEENKQDMFQLIKSISTSYAKHSYVDMKNTSKVTKAAAEPLTMVVKHYVKWERVLDFEHWTDEMYEEMARYRGFLGMTRIAPARDGDPFINAFTFDSLPNLFAFTSSTKRLELLRTLESMLESTSEAQLNQERIIQDAFTELFVSTGGTAASRPPPLWKTSILTIVPLFIIVWQSGTNLGHILVAGGTHHLLSAIVVVFVNIVLNVYIGVPLMHSQFGSWLRLERPLHDNSFILYRYLDKGLPQWLQLLIVSIYIGLNLLFGFI